MHRRQGRPGSGPLQAETENGVIYKLWRELFRTCPQASRRLRRSGPRSRKNRAEAEERREKKWFYLLNPDLDLLFTPRQMFDKCGPLTANWHYPLTGCGKREKLKFSLSPFRN